MPKSGKERRNDFSYEVLIRAVVAVEIVRNVPLFKLSAHLGFKPAAIAQFGTDENRKRFAVAFRALPVFKRQNGNFGYKTLYRALFVSEFEYYAYLFYLV